MVCNYESFRARCQPGEVIIMQRAMYGRMNSGRCLKGDQGLTECTSNVLGISDSKCSGKRHCAIQVPNQEFDNSKECLQLVRVYFEGSFDCVKGRH